MFELWRFKYKFDNVLRFSDGTIVKIISITHKTEDNRYYYDLEILHDPAMDQEKKTRYSVDLIDNLLLIELIKYYDYNNVWNNLND